MKLLSALASGSGGLGLGRLGVEEDGIELVGWMHWERSSLLCAHLIIIYWVAKLGISG